MWGQVKRQLGAGASTWGVVEKADHALLRGVEEGRSHRVVLAISTEELQGVRVDRPVGHGGPGLDSVRHKHTRGPSCGLVEGRGPGARVRSRLPWCLGGRRCLACARPSPQPEQDCVPLEALTRVGAPSRVACVHPTAPAVGLDRPVCVYSPWATGKRLPSTKEPALDVSRTQNHATCGPSCLASLTQQCGSVSQSSALSTVRGPTVCVNHPVPACRGRALGLR